MAVFPEQLCTPHAKGARGERALAAAVLDNAVESYVRYARGGTPRARREFRLASEWIFSSDRHWPFSFENICDALGVDPQCVRSALVAHASPQVTRRRPLRRRRHRPESIVRH
jgi:hypothetical protein